MIHKLISFIGSRKFFYLIVGIFALEASWIALTGRYPLPFDENFHFGVIQLYAKHWLPFLDAQPPDAAIYGAVARDPSYLYHYMLSFPYRLLAHFVSSQTIQIIVLRFINVGFAVSSLFVYAKLLREIPLAAPYRNAILVFFTAIPVFPLLAGEISYDNLLLLVVAGLLLQAVRFIRQLARNVFDTNALVSVLLLSAFASLIKYACLPIILGVVGYLLASLISWFRRDPAARQTVWRQLRQTRRLVVVFYAAIFLLLGGLFIQRYGVNVVRYHTPVPDCAQVISVDECSEYAPWGRDYGFKQNNGAWPRDGVVRYADTWLRQMMREFFFTVYSIFHGSTNVVDYWGAPPISILLGTGWVVLVAGTVLSLLFFRRLWQHAVVRLFMVVTTFYVVTLFVQNYHSYRETAIPVAIHGRYLLPLIPVIFVWFCLAAREALLFATRHAAWLRRVVPESKLAVFVLLLLLSLQGGGIITHIVRSGQENFWPQSVAAQKVNTKARHTLKKVVLQ